MNPDLRKRAETYLLSKCVSHKEWRALIVEILGDDELILVDCSNRRPEVKNCTYESLKLAPWETDVAGRGHVPPRPLPEKLEP
jgi:hypothetical protein